MPNEQPHDRLIKETLTNIREAVIFLKAFLPIFLRDGLDFRTLRHEKATFLNEAGRETYSDLVFSCQWKGSSEKVFIQVLVEHKSTPEARPYLQIGGYLSEGYHAQVLQQRKEKKNDLLIPIVPMLFYHGKEEWDPGQYEDCFNLPNPALAAYLPSFKLIYVNLAKFSDEDILALRQSFLTSTLLVFKHKNDRDYILANTGKIFIFATAKGPKEIRSRFLRTFVLYLFRAFNFQRNELDLMVQQIPKIVQPMFESTYDRLIREGETVGYQKGETVGYQKGETVGYQKGETVGEIKRSLDIVLDSLVFMPSFGDADLAKLARLPEVFVATMRKHYLNNDLAKAQKTAVGLFSDLPFIAETDLEKIKTAVKAAWLKRDSM